MKPAIANKVTINRANPQGDYILSFFYEKKTSADVNEPTQEVNEVASVIMSLSDYSQLTETIKKNDKGNIPPKQKKNYSAAIERLCGKYKDCSFGAETLYEMNQEEKEMEDAQYVRLFGR